MLSNQSSNADFFSINKKSKTELFKLEKQKACTHDYWITRCSQCSKILGSDSIRNIDDGEDFLNCNHEIKNTDTLKVKKDYYSATVQHLNKEENNNLLVASYSFEDIQVLKGQIRIYISEPYKTISKQAKISVGGRIRLLKNQSFQIKALKNNAIISIIKTNI